MKNVPLATALLLALALPAHADLIVKKNNSIVDGKVLPGPADADLLFQPALPANAPQQKIPRADISEIILTDEHGARVGDADPEKWDVPPDPAAPPIAAAPRGNSYCLIPLHGEVGETFLASALEASLADALKRHPTIVVLDIDSPGGRIFEVDALAKVLHTYNSKLRIVALAGEDFSAAAITTLSIREIYLKPTGVIGAARAYQSADGGMPEDIAEKMQSAWRAVARNSAEEGGHNPLLADAMIDASHSLVVTHDAAGKPVVREDFGENMLVSSGRILTLTSREAVACGLASGIAEDVADLGKQLKMPGWTAIPALGTLLADQLPKRQAAYDRQMTQIVGAADLHFSMAKRSDPAAGTDEISLFPQAEQPDDAGPMFGPRRRMGPGLMIHRPAMPAMPGEPMRPGIQDGIGQSNDRRLQQQSWGPKSLQCLVALQDVEEDLKRGIALGQAFGRAGDAADLQPALDKVSALRQAIYHDRNRYASVTYAGTPEGVVRSDSPPVAPPPWLPPMPPTPVIPPMPTFPTRVVAPPMPPMPPMPATPSLPSIPAMPTPPLFHSLTLNPAAPSLPANRPAPLSTTPPLVLPAAGTRPAPAAARGGAPAMRVTTLAQAQAALASGESQNIATAARFLSTAAVTPEAQPAVLKALAPLLDRPAEKNGCIAAYVHWARKEDMPALLTALQHKPDPPNDIAEAQCWATAFPTLVHFVPQDAEKAINQHKKEFFFKAGVTRQLEKIILDDSKDTATARRLRALLTG